ncbi:LutB/LldF family L-lactate oxidation iron-sulfur protein [Ureibacillus thermosphaericus]|uniref:LutB/LldF family L-lactate oxidation iron-sulfur protein n=1 Tax=Ureibacillus thermosphaericus TaxID=51173 RepID=UPI0030C8EFBB
MAMKTSAEQFKDRVENNLNDSFMRGAISSAQNRFQSRRQERVNELENWEEWRAHGEEIRKHVLDNLDAYLYELSENVMKRGGHVFFAETAEEASQYIKNIAIQKQAKKIVKSKSMVTEEIHLNAALEEAGCEVIETDLGEYIIQLNHEPPSHIIAPSLHKNRYQIRDIFAEKIGYKNSEKPEEMALYVREKLRKEFLTADIGITGCNFAVAESGTVTLVTNEGNADLVTALPKIQITVMGMERIVPTFEELDVLVSLLTRSAVGQKISSYVTMITGVKGEEESDGPEEFHLVIVDNGRSKILGTDFQPILQCIRCAACVNVCPVYRHIGGHSYGSIYSGPIGAVLTPLLGGYADFKELPYASTLCGACTEVCPVKIPLHKLLHLHRQKIVEQEGKAPISERLLMRAFGFGASSPQLFSTATKITSSMMSPFVKEDKIPSGPRPLKAWTENRDFPAPNKESFRNWLKERQKGEQG